MKADAAKTKAPFPYFGSKAKIAYTVWQALGDCGHYIEPFCGSCAVLLARPNFDPQRHVETVNDADGHIANVWRSLQQDPDEVAKWCDWPVNHADLIARKKRLNLNTDDLLERLCADDEYYNPKLAGYYIWAACCWIGRGLNRPTQTTQIPHLSDAGNGVHAKGQRPHLSNAGSGVQEPYNPNIYAWFRQLSERLRYVRVVCGDWKRVCGGNWQHQPGRPLGMFFDPPYGIKANRASHIYSTDSLTVADDVREWCRTRAHRPDYRIVLAGYYEEHETLLEEGWSVFRWSARGGYSSTARNGNETRGKTNRHREALFFSPRCVKDTKQEVMQL